MSEPGWYPDPGGRPGHYRFWDGQDWSPVTSTELPPGSSGPSGPSGTPPASVPPQRSRTRLRVALAAGVVVVLVVVGAVALGSARRSGVSPPPVASTAGAPAGTATAGSPSAVPPTTPSSEPTSTPSSTPSSTPEDVPTSESSPFTISPEPVDGCPTGEPFSRQEHPLDARVHGGGLSFPAQEGWTEPGDLVSAFTWAYDVGETDRRADQQTFSAYAVGAVSTADGFDSPQRAAELILECTLDGSFFPDAHGVPQVVRRSSTVDDAPAYTLVAQVDGDAGTGGNLVAVIVTDLGSPESLAFFWGSALRDDPALTARLETVAGQLRID